MQQSAIRDSRKINSSPQFTIRKPCAADAVRVNRLIAECKPLDTNSIYCNLLQCSHFAETCALAESDGELQGFVSAYRVPDSEPATLFFWQIAVSQNSRGSGLGRQLLQAVLNRVVCAPVLYIETSITADNTASKRLFRSLAEDLNAGWHEQILFEKEKHFAGAHVTEILLRIGPLS